jgi:transcriptional regulator with PAS, ATPase and Fis domain
MLATESRLRELKARPSVPKTARRLVFHPESPFADTVARLDRLAPTPLNVVLLGETGTGKELVARRLHDASPRSPGPFVALNCAAIPEALLESILFGHERGAFTGAVRSQKGKFEAAHRGTLFLDEVGDLSLPLQAKLLRVLQEGVVEPLGSVKSVSVDVRIVAATHKDLEAELRRGSFRQDLYFRLAGATLRLPPLRERPRDLALLVEAFLEEAGSSLKLSAEAQARLVTHAWPGNVRELAHVVSRAAWLAEGSRIETADLELSQGLPLPEPSQDFGDLKDAQREFTRHYVNQALAQNGGNRALASQRLGISERSLYRMLADAPDKEA